MRVVFIRPYQISDLNQIIEVYQSAFAESPWNEFQKCTVCNINYARDETTKKACKKCNEDLILIPYWSNRDVIDDLESSLKKPASIVLIAQNKNNAQLTGFIWAYSGYPDSRQDFLKDKIKLPNFYIDDVAVSSKFRRQGVGKLLTQAAMESAKNKGFKRSFLRTNKINPASIALFASLGYKKLPFKDPEIENNIYMQVELKTKKKKKRKNE